MLVPLFGFLKGDTIGLVVLVQSDQLVKEIANVLQEAASIRVKPAERVSVWFNGAKLDPEITVAQAGLTPLARVDVVQEE